MGQPAQPDSQLPGQSPLAVDEVDPGDEAFLQYLFSGYFALIPAGTLFLRFCALESGMEMTLDRALFWTANALTCTGFRLQPSGLAEFSTAGHIGVFVLMLAGALFALTAGGLIISRILGLAYSRTRIIAGALFFMAMGGLLGAGLLMGPGRSFFAALFEAVSSLANAGMSIDGQRTLADWRLYLIIMPLAAIGGLGLVVVLQLFDAFAISIRPVEYTWRILRWSAAAWLIGFALLLLAQGAFSRETILTSWFYAINTRSLGAEVTLPFALARQVWWLLAGLILVGGMPGGTAGGLRVTTIAEAARQIRSGKPGRELSIALLWITSILLACALVFLLLLAWRPQLGTDDAALLAAGAIGNTGLFRTPLDLTGSSLYVLTAAMFAGHLLPLCFAWYLRNTGCRTPMM